MMSTLPASATQTAPRATPLLYSAAILGFLFSALSPLAAQQPGTPSGSVDTSAPASSSVRAAVPNGTRFLVTLEDKIDSGKTKANKQLRAKTAEPLETLDGNVLPAGAQVRFFVSRIEPNGVTGHARIWLTFEDIKTPAGRAPLIVDLLGAPGNPTVRQDPNQEGVIETRTSKGRREVEAAAAGAAIGATVGAKAKGAKGAAIGAAAGAVGGFLISSGLGQELVLPKGSHLELELSRPLYIAKQ